jgi:hypothetical protein
MPMGSSARRNCWRGKAPRRCGCAPSKGRNKGRPPPPAPCRASSSPATMPAASTDRRAAMPMGWTTRRPWSSGNRKAADSAFGRTIHGPARTRRCADVRTKF